MPNGLLLMYPAPCTPWSTIADSSIAVSIHSIHPAIHPFPSSSSLSLPFISTAAAANPSPLRLLLLPLWQIMTQIRNSTSLGFFCSSCQITPQRDHLRRSACLSTFSHHPHRVSVFITLILTANQSISHAKEVIIMLPGFFGIWREKLGNLPCSNSSPSDPLAR